MTATKKEHEMSDEQGALVEALRTARNAAEAAGADRLAEQLARMVAAVRKGRAS